LVKKNKPFNAETPLHILAENFYTPNEWFYVRNHLPTPDVTADDFELEITIDSNQPTDEKVFTLSDLQNKFERVELTSAIQCGGNRRAEMNEIKTINGLMWKGGAIGNAKWAGVRLSDILKDYDLTGMKHVQFEGYDEGSDGSPYGASIPIEKAMSGDVILAYEMNGQDLPRDHGYPLRVVATGIVGARNVKWLKRIVLSPEESHSHWQRSDYKGFNPSIDSMAKADFSKSPSIQNMPVTSVICTSKLSQGQLELTGYAWAGGGNRIIRVDLTTDQGNNWHEAVINEQTTDTEPKHFGWTLWSARIPVQDNQKTEVWCKAVDSNYNSQPESFKNIWNLRGVNSNAYHKIIVQES